MRRTIVLAALLLLTLTGCTSSLGSWWRAAIPGGVTSAAAEWQGVKSGEPEPATIKLAQLAGADAPSIAALALAIGVAGGDPLGWVMPVRMIEDDSERLILCDRKRIPDCRGIPKNAKVHFAGHLQGLVWVPEGEAGLRADDYDD